MALTVRVVSGRGLVLESEMFHKLFDNLVEKMGTLIIDNGKEVAKLGQDVLVEESSHY